MPVRFACPSCRSAFTVPDGDAGKKAECPVCRQRVRVPVPRRLKTVLGEEVSVLAPDPGRDRGPPADPLPAAYDPGPLPELPPVESRRGRAGVLAFFLVGTVFLVGFGV